MLRPSQFSANFKSKCWTREEICNLSGDAENFYLCHNFDMVERQYRIECKSQQIYELEDNVDTWLELSILTARNLVHFCLELSFTY